MPSCSLKNRLAGLALFLLALFLLGCPSAFAVQELETSEPGVSNDPMLPVRPHASILLNGLESEFGLDGMEGLKAPLPNRDPSVKLAPALGVLMDDTNLAGGWRTSSTFNPTGRLDVHASPTRVILQPVPIDTLSVLQKPSLSEADHSTDPGPVPSHPFQPIRLPGSW
jgi:hypothetical protein